MWNLGYTPGTGLGKRKQRMSYPIIQKPPLGKEGLRFPMHIPRDEERLHASTFEGDRPPLTWNMSNHFAKEVAATIIEIGESHSLEEA